MPFVVVVSCQVCYRPRMENQFDRKLLRELAGKENGTQTDKMLFEATAEQLWGALACIEEPEFTKVRPFERKIRLLLEMKTNR